MAGLRSLSEWVAVRSSLIGLIEVLAVSQRQLIRHSEASILLSCTMPALFNFVGEAPEKNGSSGRTRTYNPPVNSRMLCH